MRLTVISDCHGRIQNAFEIIETHIDDTDFFISLGDCNSGRDYESAISYFKSKGKEINFISVCGNCDFASLEPVIKEFTLKGRRIMICHGHTLGVKFDLKTLTEEASRRGADLALFGHTHNQYYEYTGNIHIFNPGAVCDGYYGLVDITDGGLICLPARL